VHDLVADSGLVRAAALLLPTVAVGALVVWRRPDTPLLAGALLATVWNLPALLAVNLTAGVQGWWRFQADGGVVAGVPIDLLLGWMLLWGAVPVLAFPRAPLVVPTATFLLLDLALMPLGQPVIVLNDEWLVGEAASVAVALVPAMLLGRWTGGQRRLAQRATLQVALAGALLLWVLPLMATGATTGVFAVLDAAAPSLAGIVVVAMALAAVVGAAAVQEFVERGEGTPVPFDPPRRLVRSGPYAYIRNPMQASACLLLGLMAAVSGSGRLWIGGLLAGAYGAGLAAWHEAEELPMRFGGAWSEYRRTVRAWWPSWRPVVVTEAGTLWTASTCEDCSSVARFFLNRQGAGLHVRPAEQHSGRGLRRITYEADERQWEGVAAVARALSHLHLGWALLGWMLRLPVLVDVVQILVDAAGGGPRDVYASPTDQDARSWSAD